MTPLMAESPQYPGEIGSEMRYTGVTVLAGEGSVATAGKGKVGG